MPESRRTTLLQSGAIPYRVRDGHVEIALVTNRSGRRWIVPKGTIAPGETSIDAAIREAHEEAGVVGIIDGAAIGTMKQVKRGHPIVVTLYPLTVLRSLPIWPERSFRRREWLAAAEAVARVQHRDLARCIEVLAGRVELDRVRDASAG